MYDQSSIFDLIKYYGEIKVYDKVSGEWTPPHLPIVYVQPVTTQTSRGPMGDP